MNKRLVNILAIIGANTVIWTLFLYFSFVLGQRAYAVPNNEHTVCPAGPPACDFATIQAAVDSALAGDSIVVASGSYIENIVISKTLNVQGAGIASTIVDGNGVDRVFVIENGSMVTIRDLTITNGYSDAYGGGILNDSGSLTLNNVSVEGNSALRGGGIANFFGAITMTGGMVNHNLAIGDNVKRGAGIYNNGALSLIHTIVFSNHVEVGSAYGGGLYIANGNVMLDNATIISNSAQIGGGVYNSNGGNKTTIANSRIQLNTVIFDGGGIYNNEGQVWINNSTVDSNSAQYGGGIWNGEILTVTNSTVSNNLATNIGGGVRNSSGSSATLINSTISSNRAIDQGGGILSGFGALTLLNSTVTNNEAELGGGIYNLCCEGIITFANSIIAGNLAGNDCAGEDSYLSFGYNLDSDHSCYLTAIGDISGADPGLGLLQDNGGDTYTHALLPLSPAIDAGNPAIPGSDEYACQPLDQLGRSRPMDGDNNGSFICDMGAYELPTLQPWIYLPAILKP